MKKLLIFPAIFSLATLGNAAELPEPSVRVLPQDYGYFDAFVISWAEQVNEPYKLKIKDKSGIKVVKDEVEELYVSVGLTEYQETENSKNYPDSRLLVTISMFETSVGSSYTLTIPEGAVDVYVSDNEILPNGEVEYTFTLKADGNIVTLPEPNIEPLPGAVENLNIVKISWTGKLGSLDLLNEYNLVSPDGDIAPVVATYNGAVMENPKVSFEWSSRQAVTEGSEGDIFVITLSENPLPAGEYIITIPESYLQITDIETGTLYNDEIVLSYMVVDSESGAVTTLRDTVKEDPEIYNLNGVKINTNNLKDIPKGVYIINGKKVRI
ncbi:MAG: hypothetical protein J1E16_06745 [Muribaculaceae bacterium]|nr:hypothetical protein [Muribaculaceae bacterium]